MKELGLRVFVCVACLLGVEKEGSGWAGVCVEEVAPGVFCKRVRKFLKLRTLGKYSFLKSVEVIDGMGFTFSRFWGKSEKSE
jgi:hypothetical protein